MWNFSFKVEKQPKKHLQSKLNFANAPQSSISKIQLSFEIQKVFHARLIWKQILSFARNIKRIISVYHFIFLLYFSYYINYLQCLQRFFSLPFFILLYFLFFFSYNFFFILFSRLHHILCNFFIPLILFFLSKL